MSMDRFRLFFSLLALSACLRAQPILVDVTTHSDPPLSIHVGGSDVMDLISALVGKQNEFAAFKDHPITADIDYLGLPRALGVSVTFEGNTATLRIPSTGYVHTFTGNTPAQLQNAVSKWIKNEGGREFARFRRVVNKRSSAGVTDGNPNATTALLAGTFFNSFGLPRSPSHLDREQRTHVSLQPRESWWHSGRLSGRVLALDPEIGYRASERTYLTLLAPMNYAETGDAEIFGAGVAGAISRDLIPYEEENRWHSRATFFAGAALRGSENLAAGGAVYTWGGAVNVMREITDDLRLGGALMGSTFHGIPLDFEGYEFDKVVDQHIGKVGLVAELDLPFAAHRFVGQVTQTRLFKAAAVPDYTTVGLAYQWPWTDGSLVQIGYEADRGASYRSDQVRTELRIHF